MALLGDQRQFFTVHGLGSSPAAHLAEGKARGGIYLRISDSHSLFQSFVERTQLRLRPAVIPLVR